MTFERSWHSAPTQFHPTNFEGFQYVYPVVSRRARGVSLGVNLNPDKSCNFRCVYCQIDRSETRGELEKNVDVASCRAVDVDRLHDELLQLARATVDGSLFKHPRFATVEPQRRVLRDFAFSGDGEPTISSAFHDATAALADVRRQLDDDSVKLVLITNATRLAGPSVVSALDLMTGANGEIWAKLDAGDQPRLEMINRTRVSLGTILSNVSFAAKRWGVKVQTALFAWRGEAPSDHDFDQYCTRLREVLADGGTISAVQLYTVARVPTEPDAVPLSDDQMDRYAATLRRETGLEVEVFYSR